MIKQTLSEYMNNPSGKGSTFIPNRQLIIDDYKRRYEKIKEHHKFEVTIYKIKEDYLFHILVPSEAKDKDMYYDVVLQFTMADEDFKNEMLLKRYYVKFFSNSPSFVYTHAYAYNSNGILVDFLKKKYNHEVLSKEPSIRNPQEIITFEKSVYFACLHLMNNSITYMNKMYLNSHVRSLNTDLLLKKVRTSDAILLEYKKAEHKKKEKERKNNKEITNRTTKTPTPRKEITKSISRNKKTPVGKKTVAKKITAKKSTIKGKK